MRHDIHDTLETTRERILSSLFAALFLAVWMVPWLFGPRFVEGTLASLVFEFFMIAAGASYMVGIRALRGHGADPWMKLFALVFMASGALVMLGMGYGFGEEFNSPWLFVVGAAICLRHLVYWWTLTAETQVWLIRKSTYEMSLFILLLMALGGFPVPAGGLYPSFVAGFESLRDDVYLSPRNLAVIGVVYYAALAAWPHQRFYRWLYSDPMKK